MTQKLCSFSSEGPTKCPLCIVEHDILSALSTLYQLLNGKYNPTSNLLLLNFKANSISW